MNQSIRWNFSSSEWHHSKVFHVIGITLCGLMDDNTLLKSIWICLKCQNNTNKYNEIYICHLCSRSSKYFIWNSIANANVCTVQCTHRKGVSFSFFYSASFPFPLFVYTFILFFPSFDSIYFTVSLHWNMTRIYIYENYRFVWWKCELLTRVCAQ